MEQSEQPGSRETMEENVFPRRRFLKIFSGISLAATVGTYAVLATQNDSHQKEKSNNDTPSSDNVQQLPEKESPPHDESYIETILEQNVSQVLQSVGAALLESLDFDFTTQSSPPNEMMTRLQEKPLKALSTSCVIGPLMEEGFFRLAPSVLLDATMKSARKKIRWDIGVILSMIFAFPHNFKVDHVNKTMEYNKKSIPLSPFIGGLFYWYFMRKKGLMHAWLAHGYNNATNSISFIAAMRGAKKPPQ